MFTSLCVTLNPCFYRISTVTTHSSKSFVKAMNGQSKISSFFTPKSGLSQKRVASTKGDDGTESENKKAKVESKETKECVNATECENVNPNQGNLTVSPEQKQRIEANRRLALMKITEKKTKGVVCNFGSTWFKALEAEFSKPYFEQLCNFVTEERQKHTIFPPANEVFSFTQSCNIRDVKVVILGQDPYHGPKQAHGLCFSVQKGIAPPPSLINMYKELEKDIEGFKHPGHGYLQGWANQGVLLMNAVLTVRARNANSHKDKGWEKFTDSVIQWLNKNQSGIVFILWGSYAQKKGANIDKKKHHILKGVHPSPLSAHRGFFGCKHFSQCNELLRKQGKNPIDWNDLPLEC